MTGSPVVSTTLPDTFPCAMAIVDVTAIKARKRSRCHPLQQAFRLVILFSSICLFDFIN